MNPQPMGEARSTGRRKAWWRLVILSAATLFVVTLPLTALTCTERRSRPEGLISTAQPRDAGFSGPPPGAGVSWAPVAGIGLPLSPTAGPLCLTQGHASCFAHTQDGAAIAAVQLLVRTFPAAGPATFAQTITEQVTGPGNASLTKRTRQIYEEWIEAGPDALPDEGGGWAAGYRLDADGESPSTAIVRVLLDQPDGLTEYAVHLAWLQGDWKLQAPATGSWAPRPVSTRLEVDYRSYDQLGIGPGGAL